MKQRWQRLSCLPVGLLVILAGPAVADLPYNPTTILIPPRDDDPIAYIFTPDSSSAQLQLSLLRLSKEFNASSNSFTPLYSTLPFLSSTSKRSFIPILGPGGNITALSGDCNAGAAQTEAWRFSPEKDNQNGNGTWVKLELSVAAKQNEESSPSALGVGYLTSAFAFSPTSPSEISFYSFGGMCPSASSAQSDSSSWTSTASYSNTVLEASPLPSDANSLSFSTTSTTRAAPVPEAGLTITPLAPTFSNTSDTTNPSQNQNFVLLGGHTRSAFINMSQVALFSLPEASWTFLSIDPSSPTASTPQGDLTRNTDNSQDQNVEPRSGHSALLTPDGTRIVVFGGWVGDINTPATPQLAILEVGAGYGGEGDWSWKIPGAKLPSIAGNSDDGSGGVYGHGAAMLPGGIMLITGGYSIPNSPPPSSRYRRRQDSLPAQTPNTKTLLFNTTSLTFVSDYTHPSSPSSSHSSSGSSSSSGALHSTSQKVGLGTGLGLGFSALASLLLIYLWYTRRMRRRRHQRDSEIRELALGAQRYYGNEAAVTPPHDNNDRRVWSEKRDDQHSIKRKPVPNTSYMPWNQLPPNQRRQQHQSPMTQTGARDAERTGLLVEIPSPTRGLRRSLSSRPYAYTPGFAQGMHQSPLSSSSYGPGHASTAAGGIHPIDEREELEWDAEGKSLRSRKSNKSATDEERPRPAETARWSDPFKDPPPQVLEPAGPATISVPMTVQQHSLAADAAPAGVVTVAATDEELNRTPSQEKRERNAEVAGWVDDWTAAAANLNFGNVNVVGRSNSVISQGKTRANVSRSASRAHSHAHSHSASGGRSGTMTTTTSSSSTSGAGQALTPASGRGSPDKSDRTNSTLSEMSVAESARSIGSGSLQRSNAGTISIRRGGSQRSVSAGAAAAVAGAGNLFVGAAAAMVAGVTGTGGTGTGRRASGGRVDFREPPGAGATGADRRPWEREGLLNRTETDHTLYATPPESPVKDHSHSPSKDRANSLGLGSRAVGFLGSVKKALVGTGAVRRRVEEYEEKDKEGSPAWARGSGYWERERENEQLLLRQESAAGMIGAGAGVPRRATSAGAAFWRRRQGRADWEDEIDRDVAAAAEDPLESPTKSTRSEGMATEGTRGEREGQEEGEGADWDVEDAVQQRVVQVMFTVPKEKLRVVNVDPDGLSVVSDGDRREEGSSRDLDEDVDKGKGMGKGKGKARAVE